MKAQDYKLDGIYLVKKSNGASISIPELKLAMNTNNDIQRIHAGMLLDIVKQLKGDTV